MQVHTRSEVIAPRQGVGFNIKKGQVLRVWSNEGAQVSDLFCAAANDKGEPFSGEVLSTSRSLDYADTLYLTTGHVLYSNRSRPMLTIIEDTCGRHDLLMPPCSLAMFQIVAGNDHYHPSCHENLKLALKPYGVSEDAIGTTFNIFMNVSVAAEGAVRILPPLSKPGSFVILRAEMDLNVGLTACSHEETNNGNCKSVSFRIFDEL